MFRTEPRLRIPYWYFLLVPSIVFFMGAIMNILVIAANHASMPVLVPNGLSLDSEDWIHHAMTPATHFKWMADWIVIRGEGVASIGDYLIRAGLKTRELCWVLWATLVIRDANHSEGRCA